MLRLPHFVAFFFFNDTATTEIYTLSLHDALPIWCRTCASANRPRPYCRARPRFRPAPPPYGSGSESRPDRKSTRLNSSHANISYAVFCLKKKKKLIDRTEPDYHNQSPRAHIHAPH